MRNAVLSVFAVSFVLTAGAEFSADWPGFTRRTLEQALGDGTKCIFFNGSYGYLPTAEGCGGESYESTSTIFDSTAAGRAVRAQIGILRAL